MVAEMHKQFWGNITVVQQGAHSAVIAADRNNKQVIFKKLWKKTL